MEMLTVKVLQIKLKLNGELYYPITSELCEQIHTGFCTWLDGECHNIEDNII